MLQHQLRRTNTFEDAYELETESPHITQHATQVSNTPLVSYRTFIGLYSDKPGSGSRHPLSFGGDPLEDLDCYSRLGRLPRLGRA